MDLSNYMESLNNIENPKVSVIMPVYNVEEYLSEALDSVIAQTYKNIEIIVVDDCSSDSSGIICDEYAKKDSRIKVIHRRNNGGLSAARNTGLDYMSGDYVAFLDSDDAFLPEAIEKSLNTMLLNDTDCVIFKNVFATGKNGKLEKIPNYKVPLLMPQGVYSREDALKAAADFKINPLAWNKMTKREIWDNLRFPEGHVYEDLYTLLNMLDKTKKVYYMHDVFVLYRKREGSISATKSIENTKDFFDSWAVFTNFIETHTPELFEPEQLQKVRKKIFIDSVMLYAKVLSMQFSKKKEVLALIADKIGILEKSVNIRDCNVKAQFLHFLMKHNSDFISAIFPYYFRLYKFMVSFFRNIF